MMCYLIILYIFVCLFFINIFVKLTFLIILHEKKIIYYYRYREKIIYKIFINITVLMYVSIKI